MKNKDIFDKLQDVYAKGCVSYAWVGKWAKAFREGLTSLADDPRSRRPPIPD
jgi:transposase